MILNLYVSVVLLELIFAAVSEPLGRCPEVDNGYSVLLPDSDDFTKFYKCEEGQLKSFKCPDSLQFSLKSKSCETRDALQSNKWENNENRSEEKCQLENGEDVDFLLYESDCSKFYKCDWGKLKLFNCPSGLHFNSKLNVCDWPEQAECKGGKPSTEGPASTDSVPPQAATTSTIAPTTTTKSNDNNETDRDCAPINGEYVYFIPHESDCAKFYKCDWGELKLFNCSEGLHFNPNINVCDWPEQAGCKEGPPPTDKPAPTESAPSQAPPTSTIVPTSTTEGNDNHETDRKCQPVNDEYVYFIPHESDCTKFYKCDWGELKLFNCSGGLHFNPSLNVCDWPEQAGCKEGAPPTEKPAPTESAPSQAPSTSTIVPTNITEITEEGPLSTEEPEPTESAPSQAPPTSTIVPTSTTEGNDNHETDRKCQPVNDEYLYFIPHESDCTKFYKCDWGELKLFNCSGGLHFNPNLNVCDWPEQAGCKEGAPPMEKPAPTESAPSQAPSTSTIVPTNITEITEEGPLSTEEPEPTQSAPSQAPSTSTIVPTSTTEGNDNHETDRKCQPVNDEYVYFIPHESDCTKFYKCDWGELKLFNCSGGLHFNPSLNVCDWPEQAGCKEGAPPTEKPAPTESAPSQAPSTSTIVPTNITEITEEGPLSTEEPEPTQSAPSQAPSTSTIVPTSTTEGNDNHQTDRKCQPVNDEYVYFIPHESDCTKFYKCDWGELKLFNCSGGLHFNPSLNVCDWPEQAGCKEGAPPTEKPAPTESAPSQAPSTSTIVPTNITEITEEGPLSTEEPEPTQSAPSQAPSTSTIVPTSTTEGNDNHQTDRKCQPVNDEYVYFIPHESDCTKFYKCDWGELKLFNCSGGLHFNPSLNVCDWPEQAGCKEGAPPTEKPAPTESAPSQAPSTSTIVPTNTTEITEEGPLSTEKPEPTESAPSQAPPTSTIVPISTTEGNDNHETDRKCQPVNDEYVYFIPHESDCTKFYKCDWGELKLFNCSGGLHFNPSLNVCDWPEQAGCKDGPPPTEKPAPTESAPSQAPSTSTIVPTNTTEITEEGPLSTEKPEPTESAPSQAPPTSTIVPISTTEGNDNHETDRKCQPVNYEYVYFIPHESDCTKFYKCDWGELKLFNCSGGLHFNPSLNVCDWPEQAGCKDGPPPTEKPAPTESAPSQAPSTSTIVPTNTTEITEEGPLSTEKPEPTESAPSQAPPTSTIVPISTTESNDNHETDRKCQPVNDQYVYFIPHESDCTKFYKCDWGELKLFNCSGGLHFNPSLNVCDWPEQAGCKDGPPPTEKPAPTESAPSQAPSASTIVPTNTTEITEEGPLSTEKPEPTESAPSQAPPTSTIVPTSTTEGNDNHQTDRKCQPVNDEYVYFIPHESDCTKFYKCDWGELKLFNCSGGLHFNPSLNVCDWPEQAGCKDGPPPTEKPAPTESAPSQAPSTSTIVPTNITEITEEGPLSTEKPEPTESAPSQAPPTSTIVPTSTTEGNDNHETDRKCQPVNDEYVYFIPHESDCTKFYKCDWGELKLFNCSDELHFNPSLNVCDWPEQAGCKEGSASTEKPALTESTPSQAPSISTIVPTETTKGNNNDETERKCPPLNGEYGFFVPHESDCTKFYKCDNGKLKLFSCPNGLHFSSVLDVCDWPENTKCIQEILT